MLNEKKTYCSYFKLGRIHLCIVLGFLRKSLSARTTALGKILLLFYQPFHAQEALDSTLKLQYFSPRITLGGLGWLAFLFIFWGRYVRRRFLVLGAF